MEALLQQASELRQNGKVDVVQLARKVGIEVKPSSKVADVFMEASAYIKKEPEGYVIYVNADHSKQRQRFSIAHEIAHFHLHKDQLDAIGQLDRDGAMSLGVKEEEKADELASEILMPQDDIADILKRAGITQTILISRKQIEVLCERYDVSFFAMIVKLRSLSYYVPYISVY